MAFATDTRSASISLADRFATFRANLAEAMANRKLYRRTLSELEALSNRELADLGINRSMIKSIALQATQPH